MKFPSGKGAKERGFQIRFFGVWFGIPYPSHSRAIEGAKPVNDSDGSVPVSRVFGCRAER